MFYILTRTINITKCTNSASAKKHTTSSMQEHPLKTANVKIHERRNITYLKPDFLQEPSTFILYFASHTIPFLSGI